MNTMGLGNNVISISFHWSSEVLTGTIITLVILVGSFYILETTV